MEQGTIRIFYGEGNGKSSAAVGMAVKAAMEGKSVVLIQFLKGRQNEQETFAKKLEPDIKWFSFEKEDCAYDELPEDKKQEAVRSIQNGMNFARKVLTTNEADVVILDEVLGLTDNGMICADDILALFDIMWEDTELILTGRQADDRIIRCADCVSRIEKVK